MDFRNLISQRSDKWRQEFRILLYHQPDLLPFRFAIFISLCKFWLCQPQSTKFGCFVMTKAVDNCFKNALTYPFRRIFICSCNVLFIKWIKWASCISGCRTNLWFEGYLIVFWLYLQVRFCKLHVYCLFYFYFSYVIISPK